MTKSASDAESRRMSVLRDYGFFDSRQNDRFDEIVSLAAQLCDAPMAAFSVNDHSRERFVSCYGFSLDKIPLEKGFSDFVVGGGAPLLVNDARNDARFPRAPLLKAEPKLRFYAGVPVIGGDTVIGTLAVMDRTVRHLPRQKLAALATLAAQVKVLLDVERYANLSCLKTENGQQAVSQLDFQTVFSSVPGLHWLIEPEEFRVVAITGDVLNVMKMEHKDVIGQPIDKILAAGGPDAASRNAIRKQVLSLERVKKTQRADKLIAQSFAVPVAESEGGGFRQHYWTSINAPIHDADGRLVFIVNNTEDVTAFAEMKEREGKAARDQRSLEARAQKMEANILERTQEMERLYEHMRMAQHVANVGSWEIGLDDDPTRTWSDEVYSILGLNPARSEPEEDLILSAIHPDDRERLLEERAIAVDETGTFTLTHRIVRPDGDVRNVWQQARVATDAGGTKIKLYGTLQDITEQKRVEAELQTRARQQEVVARLGQMALSDPSLEALRNQAVKVVAQTLDVEYCKVLELLPDKSAVKLVAGVGWKEGLVGNATVGVDNDSQAGFTLMSDECVIVADLRIETRFNGPSLLVDHGVISGISMTIAGQHGPWGVLGAHTTRLREFTQDDVNFFGSVANIIAEATYRVRIHEEMAVKAAHQAALSKIVYKALKGDGIRKLQSFAAKQIAKTLGVEYCKITELLADGSGMKIVAGTGWQKGVVGHTILASGERSHGRYVIESTKPVTATDIPTESRFRPSRLLIDHGIDSSIWVPLRTADGPLGLLGAHTTRRRWFTEDEKDFVATVAKILAEISLRRDAAARLAEPA